MYRPYSTSKPNAIVDLLKQFKSISEDMLRDNKSGYLGKISIDSRPTHNRKPAHKGTHEFIVRSGSYSYHQITYEEGLLWKGGDIFPLPSSQINLEHLVRYCESVLFRIYKESGYGTLDIEFSRVEPNESYRLIVYWFHSYRETTRIKL